MNFAKVDQQRRPRLMQAGDLVIVYERHDALDHLYLRPGSIFQNKFGCFPHNDMIGKPFGSKIESKSNSPGWIYILEPSPELWSSAVHTRTQIVNELDSSVVTLLLDVYPGCRVVESGTGSGCMTLSLARAVQGHSTPSVTPSATSSSSAADPSPSTSSTSSTSSSGQVFTFEYNAVRAAKAVEEFHRLQVSHLITVQCRDVCGKLDEAEGGGFGALAEQSIDAVFLDLPEPWLALEHAKKVLKAGRGICCYSPCIEQVIKAVERLRELGFHSIRMIEARQRPYDGRVAHLDTLCLGLEPDEERAVNASEGVVQRQHYLEDEEVQPGSKRARPAEGTTGGVGGTTGITSGGAIGDRERNRPKSSVSGWCTSSVARPLFSMKGHTAFLTFAVRPAS